IALVGSAGPGAQKAIDQGLTAWFSIADGPMSLDESIASTPRLLSQAAFNLLRFKLSKTAAIE
ncbi:MAG TPA: glycerate kinase, partial [Tepidisphaeraceae bacterium]|nr:glycerate kinase [Tepidisphaeraceae bacterium]